MAGQAERDLLRWSDLPCIDDGIANWSIGSGRDALEMENLCNREPWISVESWFT